MLFVDPTQPSHAAKLYWLLYGLKQALRAWFTCLSSHLYKLGFPGLHVDTCIFICWASEYTILMLVLHRHYHPQ